MRRSTVVGCWSRGALLLMVLGLSAPVRLAHAQEGKADTGVSDLLKQHDLTTFLKSRTEAAR
jgi:hypothetical protein